MSILSFLIAILSVMVCRNYKGTVISALSASFILPMGYLSYLYFISDNIPLEEMQILVRYGQSTVYIIIALVFAMLSFPRRG